MKRYLTSLLIAFTILFPANSYALYIRSYSPAQDNRFYSGSDKNFLGKLYDFSGVGFSSSNAWATLVANNYFLSANHYHPATGNTVTFYATNSTSGPSYTYTVTGGMQIAGTDLWLGWFGSSVNVNSSIARYPIEILPTSNAYKNQILYTYGLDQINRTNQVVGRNVLDNLSYTTDGTSTGLTAWYDYDGKDTPSVNGDESYLLVGDSGAPSFVVVGSKLALVGIHWAHTDATAVNGASSVDTFVPQYFSQLNLAMTSRAESLTAVPEPSVLWYMPVMAIGIMLQQKHRTSARLLAKSKNSKTSG
jgi:hypothetical protein